MFTENDVPAKYRGAWKRAISDPRLTILDNPVTWARLNVLRDKNATIAERRGITNKITNDLAQLVASRDAYETVRVQTPMTTFETAQITAAMPYTLVPILRGGVAMLHGMLKVIPDAAIAFIGMYREEITHKPVEYYHINAPKDVSAHHVVVIDPMFATGGSAIDTVDAVVREGVPESHIELACIFAAPEGVEALLTAHPEVHVYAATLDWGLNSKAYILPGCGDFGDLWCGTV